MEFDRAKEIMQALADGVDPYTGERFPADGPYQRADTVRALQAILEAAESGKRPRKPVDPNKPPPAGNGPKKRSSASARPSARGSLSKTSPKNTDGRPARSRLAF